MARISPSLDVLRAQVMAANPGVPKKDFGWIGDREHQARDSEHNEDENGFVRALDVPHAPKFGVNANQIAKAIAESKDSRILYIISNGQILHSTARSGRKPWVWMPYHGKNPHYEHAHFSVLKDPKIHGKTTSWALPKKIITPVDLKVNRNIVATTFDDTVLAYQDVPKGHLMRYGVALPGPFPSPRPQIEIWPTDRPALKKIADIIDKGPHNVFDLYWEEGRRPLVETQFKNKVKSQNGIVPRNTAGIDLTPPLNEALGLKGKGLVDWRLL